MKCSTVGGFQIWWGSCWLSVVEILTSVLNCSLVLKQLMCTVFVLQSSQTVYVTGLCTDCITQLPSHLGSSLRAVGIDSHTGSPYKSLWLSIFVKLVLLVITSCNVVYLNKVIKISKLSPEMVLVWCYIMSTSCVQWGFVSTTCKHKFKKWYPRRRMGCCSISI